MKIPGPHSLDLAERLARRESRNVTYFASDSPVFWESAAGAVVTDVDGNHYIDCTAAFGVANAGHGNPRVVAAVVQQAERLAHAMGDVHPTEIRVRLLERLAAILPPGLDKAYVGTTGSEAIETALKTAMLYTGKSGFAAYRGGYHGLSLGALAVAGIERFRAPFAAVVDEPVLLPFPADGATTADAALREAERILGDRDDLAAIVVEPIQGRGGVIVPPAGYLRALQKLCSRRQLLLIVDEIYTGFGRTGTLFAIEREGIVPDILCIGKALANGFPIGAAIARAAVMDAWPRSTGEALHTSTFLGNPLACAAALATIDEIERLELPARARYLGSLVAPRLEKLRTSAHVADVRGRGLLRGVAMAAPERAAAIVRRALADGVIFLQSGVDGSVITIAPPLTITEAELARALDVLEGALAATA